jgi:UDP-N-acetylmuramyl pentapeptide phosphotransferase/UDP-N-acetylglucosamine-1-phosphate transferase
MFDIWRLLPHGTLLAGFLAMGLSAVISLMAIPVIVNVARQKGLTDKPNSRSSHEKSIPSLGGIAIFSGLFLGSLLLMPPEDINKSLTYALAGTFILFMVGLKDDLTGLTWYKKAIAEFVACLILIVLGNVRFTTFFGVFGLWELHPLVSVVFSLIIFMSIINAYNLIDGIDGLASGTGILTSFLLGAWMYAIDAHGMAVLAWSLTGSLLPFFYFNVFGKKYKLFMGDTGSLMMGMVMAPFTAIILGKGIPSDNVLYLQAAPAVLVAVLIYPLWDLLRVATIRIWKGRSPFKADRNHMHHLFLEAGYSHRRSTFYILTLNVLAIAWAYLFRNGSKWFLLLTLLGFCLIGTAVIWEIGRRRKAEYAEKNGENG